MNSLQADNYHSHST